MPIRMPSIVSAERSRCVRTASLAVRNVSRQLMPAPGPSLARRAPRPATTPGRRGSGRCARPVPATSGSCVMSTIVRPGAVEVVAQARAPRRSTPSRGCRSARRRGCSAGSVTSAARDRDALLLAAGELAGLVVGAVGEPDLVERVGERALRRSPRSTPVYTSGSSTLRHAGRYGEQVELLEHEADRSGCGPRRAGPRRAPRRPDRRGGTCRRSARRGSRGCASASTCPNPTAR